MSANVDRVEHAITETLNGMQLGEKCIVSTELNELRLSDPSHWQDNAQLYAKMTSNYQGFPHLEIENAAAQAASGNPVPCPDQSNDCPRTDLTQLPSAPPENSAPQVPPPQMEVQPPQPQPQPQQQMDLQPPPPQPQMEVQPPPPPPPPPPPETYAAPEPSYSPDYPSAAQPNVLSNVLGGLVEGLGIGAAVALGGRFGRPEGFREFGRPEGFREFGPHPWERGYNTGGLDFNLYPPVYPQAEPIYATPYEQTYTPTLQQPVDSTYAPTYAPTYDQSQNYLPPATYAPVNAVPATYENYQPNTFTGPNDPSYMDQ